MRPIYEIAKEIRETWKPVSPFALPYLQAMFCLNKVTDKYYMDDAKSIILYFLSNAQNWKGETAKRIKTELKEMIK